MFDGMCKTLAELFVPEKGNGEGGGVGLAEQWKAGVEKKHPQQALLLILNFIFII